MLYHSLHKIILTYKSILILIEFMEYIIRCDRATKDFLINFLQAFLDIQWLETVEIGICIGCKTILKFDRGGVFIDEIFL